MARCCSSSGLSPETLLAWFSQDGSMSRELSLMACTPKLVGMCKWVSDFLVQDNFAPAYTVETTSKCFYSSWHCCSWLANWPELTPIGNIWRVVKRLMKHHTQQYRWAESCYQSNLSFTTLPDALIPAEAGPSVRPINKNRFLNVIITLMGPLQHW